MARRRNSSEKALYQRLRDAGATLDHHESDLYVLATPETREILREWRTQQKHAGVAYTTFQSEGKTWFDVPFAYEPFWEKKSRRPNTRKIGEARSQSEKSCGFAIGVADQQMVAADAMDFVEEHGREGYERYLTKDGHITSAGWEQLNKDIPRLERNALAWLEKTFVSASDEGHGSDGDLIGTVWYDPSNSRQMELLELASDSGRSERIDFKDTSFGNFRTAMDGVSPFGQIVLGGAIVFFDVDEEF